MPCRAGMVGAGVLLLLAAGCAPNLLTVSNAGREGKEPVVEGSVARVSAELQTTLAEAGIAVIEKGHDSVVRLTGRTRSRKLFCLLLRPAEGPGRDRTVLTVKWGGEPDEEFWRLVLQTVPTAPANRSNQAEQPAPGDGWDSVHRMESN